MKYDLRYLQRGSRDTTAQNPAIQGLAYIASSISQAKLVNDCSMNQQFNLQNPYHIYGVAVFLLDI
jgi:hypothetical protein